MPVVRWPSGARGAGSEQGARVLSALPGDTPTHGDPEDETRDEPLLRRLVQRAASTVYHPQSLALMSPPGAHRRYRCLAVADVDLDAGTAVLRPSITTPHGEPEGVRSLVWFHGQPIGDVTLPGPPDVVLCDLPARAAREFDEAIVQHLLRDSLMAPDGVQRVLDDELHQVPHPQRVGDTTDITVAVCTRDRAEDLQHCLRALSELSDPVAEVLVIDNASRDDRTRQVAEDFGVRCVREPRAGLDWARNRALLEARGSIVAFADDDVLVHPRWVQGLARAFAEEPDATLVTGLVAPAELATPAQVLFEVFGGFGRGYERRWFSVAVDAGEVAARTMAGTGTIGTGANMAVRRDAALALGGFDPALDVGTPTGGGGDLEMYFRVLAAGELVVYEPGAVVYHRHRTTMDQLERQMRGNGTGSYSIFCGAGRNYGAVQAREMLLSGARWMYRHHLKSAIRNRIWPRMYPPRLITAETRGAFAAVLHRYYRRAQEQARDQSVSYPDEPTAPPLVHRAASPRGARTSASNIDIDVDVLREGVLGLRRLLSSVDHRTEHLRVQVMRDGQPRVFFTVHNSGSRVSPVRLSHELATHLEPAVVVPGTS